jgi:hypothetical protein
MTKADRFTGVWEKINRAKYHADELVHHARRYWDSQPYEIIAQQEGPDYVWRVKNIREPLPIAVTMATGDAVHNLRSAFDHFAYVAVPQPHNHQVAFPIWRKGSPNNAAAWKGSVKGMLNGASSRLIAAVDALQCYQGGTEDWVRTIDYLDIVDKHQLLLTVASASTGITLDAAEVFSVFREFGFPSTPISLKSADWEPVEQDLIIYTVKNSQGPAHNTKTKFNFDVTLGEPGLEGISIGELIPELIEKSENLLKALIPLG